MKKMMAASGALMLFGLLSLPVLSAEGEAPKFEMTTYYVAFLHRGPKWTKEHTPELEKLQEAHLANIRSLGESGKLLLAGPFSDDGELRGMFVFRVASVEEARALCDTDPAVQAGRLKVELHPWFAPKDIRVGSAEPKGDSK